MTNPLADLQRADAHARWRTADHLALRPEAAAELGAAPVLTASMYDDEDDARPAYTVDAGVAVVRVEGALMDRGGWCWMGYDEVERAVLAAMADASVRAVMLDLDSPGGMVAGLFDCMRSMRAARTAGGKRLVAWVGSGAYSAAYGLASVCDEIVTSDSAGVGSVGVIAMLVSRADQLAADGVSVRVIASGGEKTDGHPAVAITDGAEARLRARVMELAGMFFAEVGTGRPALTAEVLGELDGGVRYGRAALAAGLSDRISTRSALLAELKAAASARPQPPRMGQAHRATRTTMDETLLAALSAATGETDPSKAVRSLLSAHTSARDTIAKLSADVASANERAASAEARSTEMERAAEIEGMKAGGQWSPALDGFLATQSVEQLRAFRAIAPRVVPAGEVKPPSEAPKGGAKGAPSALIAAAIEKAEASGWLSLSAGEKAAITRHDADLANALRGTKSR